jgi:hypothetical protein
MTHTTPTTTTRRPRKTAATKTTPAKGTRKAAAKPTAAEIDGTAMPSATSNRARTTAATEGEMTCRVCAKTLPVTRFPTKAPAKDGTVHRDDRCRACRDQATAARKAAKGPAPRKRAAKK